MPCTAPSTVRGQREDLGGPRRRRTLATHCACPVRFPERRPTPVALPPQLCMATVYSLLYGALGRKITGEAKAA